MTDESPPKGLREGHGVTVLLIDDDESVRFTMRERLESLGYAVEEAEGALAGVQLARVGRFDLCFLDIMMPNIDGIKALRLLNEAAPRLKVVFLTASNDDQTFQRAVNDNPSLCGFVTKPVDRESLERCLETVLRRGGKYLALG